MDIIPVIDIRKGVAVRAIAGRRDDYLPLVSPLASTSAPIDVAEGLMSLHAFKALYIADLDAIEGRGDHCGVVRAIAGRFPGLNLWVDAGFRRAGDARDWLAIENVMTVFGSETLESIAALEGLAGDARAILSLDFRGGRLLGPSALLSSSAHWAPRIIVMSLDRVGAGAGPDLDRLAKVRAAAGGRTVIAAGGVRGAEDLAALSEVGVDGALVATALHEGKLATADFAPANKKGEPKRLP